MAGNLSTVGEGLASKWLFSDSAVTRPTQWFLALYTSAPSDGGGGTEVTGGSYARQEVSFDSDGALNDADLVFGPASASWGTVTHAAIYDQLSRFLAWAALSSEIAVPSGDSLTLATGALSVVFD